MNSVQYQFDLISHLVWRDFTLRYKRSVLGVLWSFLPPLAQLIVLVFLFEKVIPLNIDAYPVFVFSALLPWVWFSACLNSAGNLFVSNRDLFRRPNFNPSILIIVNTLSNLINYLIFVPFLSILLLSYGRSLNSSLFFLPLLVLIQTILVLGLSWIIATWNVIFRDVQYIVSIALMLLFYLTPVFYAPEAIGEKYRILFRLNPVAILIQSYRTILFYGLSPEWESLVMAAVISIFFLCLGYFVYWRQLDHLYDMI